MPDEKSLHAVLTAPTMQTQVTGLSTKLMTDEQFRSAFINDPNAALKQAGIQTTTQVKLNDRDKLLLKMVSDTEISTLYKAGNMANLQKYLTANYGGLKMPGGSTVEGAAADFDVLIEAEAVAVAVVAVAAIAIGTVAAPGVQEALQDSAALNARVAALEARMRTLENKG